MAALRLRRSLDSGKPDAYAQGAVVPDGVANESDPTHRGRLGKGVGLPSAS